MPRAMLRGALLALTFAAGTWLGGWWSIPLIAAGWSVLRRVAAWEAALAAAVAWAGLLLALPVAPLGRLLGRLGGLFQLPGMVLIVLALGYVALLGWSAARLTRGLRGEANGATR